jgi:hypothetical protein
MVPSQDLPVSDDEVGRVGSTPLTLRVIRIAAVRAVRWAVP